MVKRWEPPIFYHENLRISVISNGVYYNLPRDLLCTIVLFVLLLHVQVNSYGPAGQSVHLTTFFLGKLEQAINQ